MSTDSPMRTAETTAAGTGASFGPLKQIDAGLLNVGYAEAGPADSPAAILLHGWPYDIHSYGAVAPMLASAGYRVIVPYLRGYGTTRFLSAARFRNGQQAALGVDVVALMHTLGIERAIIAGFDWRWPASGRCRPRLSCSGGISSTSRPSAVASVTTGTGGSSQGSSGERLRQDGTSTTRPSTAVPRRSATRDTGEAA